jgi:hypothetical protein
MLSDDQRMWWIDETSLPDIIWALLRVLPNGSAEVLYSDGESRSFDSPVSAGYALSEDEYVSSIDAEMLHGLSLDERDFRPPVGETDTELLPQMYRPLDCADAIRDLAAVAWLEPWTLLAPSNRDAFETELRRELDESHSLHSRDARAYLRRIDCDDVLFILSRPVELAVVHLTYTKHPPDQPPWPRTEICDQVWRFVDRTLRDAAEY